MRLDRGHQMCHCHILSSRHGQAGKLACRFKATLHCKTPSQSERIQHKTREPISKLMLESIKLCDK